MVGQGTFGSILRSAILIAGGLLACHGILADDKDADPPPNFVVLFADDLGYGDIGSYGHPYIRTPSLDEMAVSGQRWTDFYVAAPVCSPSRAALLTGRLPVRTGQYGKQIGVYFPNEPGGFPAGEQTLAELLEPAGYVSGIFGKWHLGDKPAAYPTRHGFDEWLGLPYSNDMDWVDEPDIDGMIALVQADDQETLAASRARRQALYAEPRVGAWNVPLIVSRKTDDGFEDRILEQPAEQTTLTKRYTEAAVAFMTKHKDRPFFVYLPYAMPHTPLFRSREFEGRSLGGRYGDVVEEIDWSVGQIRAALRRLNLAQNTFVLFTSDNGPWLTMLTEGGRSGLLRAGKGTTFEGGMRVPTFVEWPRLAASGTVSEMGSTLDLFRTFATLAGVDGAAGVDGHDLSEFLLGHAEKSPRNELAYYRRGRLFAYRVGRWKLHLATEGAYGQPPVFAEHTPPLLYDLMIDPSERFDVAAANPEVVADILAAIEKHRGGLTVLQPAMDARFANATAASSD